MKSRRRLSGNIGFCTCLCILAASPQFVHADQSDLVTLAREGHRAARQSIHSFSATVRKKTISFKEKFELDVTAKYRRSFDMVHIREKSGTGGGSVDVLMKDGETRVVGRGATPPAQGGRIMYIATRNSETESNLRCDVWAEMMIDHIGPKLGRYTLDRYLDFSTRPLRAKRVSEGGHDCVCLTINTINPASKTEYEGSLFFDVDRNYLIWKEMGTFFNKPLLRYEREILEFAEPVPGVFIPIKCLAQWFEEDGAPHTRVEMVLSDVEVNKPLPAGAFQLPAVPAGTTLNDKIRGETYAINEKWERIGPVEPLRQIVVPSVAQSQRSDFHSQSTSEAKPLSSLLAPAALLILVIACSCLVRREYKSNTRLRKAALRGGR